MPTALNITGFRFSFFAADRHELRHMHVRKSGKLAKYWLDPISQEYNYGYARSEIRQIEQLLEEHIDVLRREWDTFCGS